MRVRPGERVNAKAGEWATRLAGRLNPDDAVRISQRMLDAIDEASSSRWDAATQRAAALPGDIRPEKVRPDFDGCFALRLVRGRAVGECFHYTEGFDRVMPVR